jgi:hypothetical protein
MNALVAEADAGGFIGTSTTFEQLCIQWLALAENDLSPTTLRRYKNLLSKRILPAVNGQFLVPARGQQKSQPFTRSLLLF